jgi:methyl-accepting chemotaxis protein
MQVVGSVQNVTDIMARMREASAEQSRDLEEINQAIAAFDETTQENAQLVQEDAAASEALRLQAEQLAELVSAFRLDAAPAARAARLVRV